MAPLTFPCNCHCFSCIKGTGVTLHISAYTLNSDYGILVWPHYYHILSQYLCRFHLLKKQRMFGSWLFAQFSQPV